MEEREERVLGRKDLEDGRQTLLWREDLVLEEGRPDSGEEDLVLEERGPGARGGQTRIVSKPGRHSHLPMTEERACNNYNVGF